MTKMRGITCCGDCGYYNWKKHKCTRATDEGDARDKFYADCPLPDVVPAQEPRVMTLSGVRNLKESTPIWLEDVDKKDVIGALFMRDYSGTKCIDFAIVRDWEFERVVADYMDYGIRWRCWTSHPSDEMRRETPWEMK